ncbi:hypothetical protein MMC28_003139 [Mycoblastus sanguinarius]|nr:hypothetical protein [Mycoblastus sanguinarius]
MAKSKTPKPAAPKSPSPAASTSPSPETPEPDPEPNTPQNPATKTSAPAPPEDFSSYYLKRLTVEFADDIDKIRNASDFKEGSVPVLIQALKQGAQGFSEEERARVMMDGK